MRHDDDVAIVDRAAHDHGHPIAYIAHDPEATSPDSGFVLLTDDALELDQIPDHRLVTLCLHCLIDQHPDVGAGLDLARRSGAAIRDGDDWIALELARSAQSPAKPRPLADGSPEIASGS